ncbi:MAG: ABC transporter substrate-binding protein [Rhizobiales bacterium]|nr:ABC transporter substrate-binding protein [Hyphomicrobiales bacterium]OJX98608.1 MAG: ferrichrome ABC transporter substrate-binding protein [Rhizobiales bacterium 63-22]
MRHGFTFSAAMGGLMLAALAAPAFAADAKTTTVVDDRGVTVTVPAKAERVAGVSYFAADLAFALGLKPVATTYMVAGRNPDYLLGLTKDIKQIGQRAKPNLELLSEAKPDLIVAIRRYTEGDAAQFQKIAPYVAYNMELLTESYKEVDQLSALMGKPERGKELNAAFRQHMAEYAQKAPKGKHPSFLITFGGDDPFAFHTENTAAAIVAALGGNNVAGPMAKGGRFGINLSLEDILAKDPDIIFVIDYYPDRPQENNPIWKQLSAVKNHRVYYVGDEWAETNGPIAREMVLREAAHYLYPDTFPAVDVRAEAAKFIPAELRK